ncbi:MAG: ATP-binding protein [Polyangiaceae bacterium]
MNQTFWAGITVAETASQLAFGSVLLAGNYVSSRVAAKDVPWLTLAAGAFGTSMVSASISLGLSGARVASSWSGACFAVGLLLAVASLLLALLSAADVRVPFRTGLPVVAVAGLAGVLFFRSPPLCVGATIELSASGRALVAAVAVLLGFAAFFSKRRERAVHVELACLRLGACLSFLFCVFDVVGPLARRTPIPLLSHIGLPWALTLAAVALARRERMLSREHALVAELAHCREELSANNASLERMQGELGTKKQLAAVGELAAAIAHEVRNPLAIIMNAAAGLRRPTLQIDDRNTLLGILDEETARLNRLVTDLLRFARPVIIKRSSVSISELAKRVEGRLDDDHVLAVSIPDDPLLRVVQADANLLRLVFDNLVANAFQAMPEGGTVHINVGEQVLGETPFVRIEIVDHGHGMDEQVLERATDPFYTTRPSGTGLGLPIVQRIVEAHGGRIEIESALGQGTKVIMFIPKLSPEEEPVMVIGASR